MICAIVILVMVLDTHNRDIPTCNRAMSILDCTMNECKKDTIQLKEANVRDLNALV